MPVFDGEAGVEFTGLEASENHLYLDYRVRPRLEYPQASIVRLDPSKL